MEFYVEDRGDLGQCVSKKTSNTILTNEKIHMYGVEYIDINNIWKSKDQLFIALILSISSRIFS